MFGGKPKKTPKEQARETKRELDRSEREMDRDLRALERQEKELIAEIKKAAKDNNQKVMRTLAGQLVGLRNQRDRMIGMKATIKSAGYRATTIGAQAAVASTMANVSKVMGQANAQMDPKQMAQVMNDFAKQNEYMNIKEDLIDDALADAFDGDEVEEEADGVVNQVLAEIGLDFTSKMADAPQTKLPGRATKEAQEEREGGMTLEELERALPKLAGT